MSASPPPLAHRLLVASLVVGLPALSPEVLAQELATVVPSNAYSYMHVVADPSMDFVHEKNQRVWQAVEDARFHEVVIDLMRGSGTSASDVEQAQALVDTVSRMVESVAWSDLVENEIVYAEVATPVLGDWILPGLFSYLFASRPPLDKLPELERSLVGLMRDAADMSPDLALVDEIRPGDLPTRVYTLGVDEGDSTFPVVHLAIRGDVILAGVGGDAFERSLALLEGRSTDSLVRTERFRNAVGEIDHNAPQFVYFDVEMLIDSLFDQLAPIIIRESGDDWRVRSGLDDVHALIDFVDTSVTAIHAEGDMLVSECWTRFDPLAASNGNPLYAAMSHEGDASDLLDYVPAEATSFTVSGGIDLRPLYHWGIDRAKAYVPEAGDGLLLFEGTQALLDISVEDDILSWLGSETVMISMPAVSGPAGEDNVVICRLRDPDGARKVIERAENVWTTMVPPLLRRLEREKGASVVVPKIDIRPSEGSLPSMKRLAISFEIPGMALPIPPIPEITYGILGNQLIFTTSERALLHVMDVAAGEAEGLWEHPAMTDARLPEGPMTSLSFQPVGKQMAEAAQGFQMAGSVMSMMMKQAARGAPEATVVADSMAQIMTRTARIMAAIDFLEDEVTFSQSRDDGLTSYSRTTTRYRD